MIRLLAPRCGHRRNQPSFRVLMCRAHNIGCGEWWLATSDQQVAECLVKRESHEGLCPGRDFANALRAVQASGRARPEPRQIEYPVTANLPAQDAPEFPSPTGLLSTASPDASEGRRG